MVTFTPIEPKDQQIPSATFSPVAQPATIAGRTAGDLGVGGVGQTAMNQITNFTSGVNNALATIINAPVGSVQELINMASTMAGGPEGIAGDPQAVKKYLKRGMRKLGMIDEGRIDTAAATLGEDVLAAAAAVATMGMAAGPAQQAGAQTMKQAGPLLTRILGADKANALVQTGQATKGAIADITKLAASRPGTTFAGELGSRLGAREGGKASEAMVGSELPGALAGALIGGGIATAMTGGVPKKLIPEERSAFAPGSNVEATAYVDQFAKSTLKAQKDEIERGIKRAIKDVRIGARQGEPLARAEKLATNVTAARRQATQVADKLWAKIPTRKIAVPKDVQARLVRQTAQIGKDISRLAHESEPTDFMTRIVALRPRPIKDSAGNIIGQEYPKVTLEDLKQLRSVVNGKAREVIRQSGGEGDPLYRNLSRLGKILGDAIDNTAPDNRALKEANNWTKWMHNRFDRGPLAKLVMRNEAAMADFEPGGVEGLLNRAAFGGNLKDVRQVLDRPTVETDADQWIRHYFRQVAEDKGPEAADKFINSERVRRFAQQFPKMAGQLADTHNKLVQLFDQRQAMLKNAFAKFAEEDPETAIGKMFLGSNKKSAARTIVKQFDTDPTGDAIQHLRAGVMHEFMRRNGVQPERMKAMLNQKDIRSMMNEVFTQDTMRRLERMIDVATTIRDPRGLRRAGHAAASIFGRVIGAQLGRAVARRMGGGTVQTPAIFARATSNLTDSWVKGMPLEELMVRAAIDPKWERVLLSRAPETFPEIQKTLAQFKALIGTASAGIEAAEGSASEASQ